MASCGLPQCYQILDAALGSCKDVFTKPAHARSQQEAMSLLQLLDGLQLLEGLSLEAKLHIALHAQLLVLQQGVELPGLQDEDPQQLYSVIHGSVILLHGSPEDPELQQLVQVARTDWAAAEAAAAEERQAQQQLSQQAAAATAPAAESWDGPTVAEFGTNSGTSSVSCLLDEQHQSSSCTCAWPGGSAHPGVWQRVMTAVSQGSKLQLQNDMNGNAGCTTTPVALHLQQQGPAGQGTKQTLLQQQGVPSGGMRGSIDAKAAGHGSHLTLSTAEEGQSFCLSKFSCGSPSAEGLLPTTKAPSTCVAVAAPPNCVAAVLAVSKPVYREVLRLHHEQHVAHALGLLCRVPSMQHAPLKELTKLAAHLKETTFTKGQAILKQGQDGADIHFIVKGRVHLTYSAMLSHVAAHAAARLSSCGAQPQAGAALASSAGIVAAAVGPRASGGCFSGLAQALRLEQTSFEPPVVLATRGPGAVLGDDAVRDKQLAVGVVAAQDCVVTLRVSPQKFLSTLDPLTLRLFSRLRQQQDHTLQDALAAAASATAVLSTGQQQQQHPADTYRAALLHDVYNNNIPSTLMRSGPVQGMQAATKPVWHSLRGKLAGDELNNGATAGKGQHGRSHVQLSASHGCPRPTGCAAGGEEQADAAWEAQLPSGLTGDNCEGLPQTASVRQLVEVIKDVSEYRKLHRRATSVSAAAITAVVVTAAARAASASLAGATDHSLLSSQGATNAHAASAAAAAAANVAAALAARGSCEGSSSSSSHTELFEACCVAVLKVQVLPGQSPVDMAALSGVLDDVYAACGALAYDEGLQVVRWGPGVIVLLAPIEPGCPEAAGVECAAEVLLSAAARLEGLTVRAEGTLPMVRLAAGLAHGSAFVDYEAGSFISAMSGRTFAAAEALCEAASTTPSWALPQPTSSTATCSTGAATSQAVLLVSDGIAALLQQGCSYSLQAAGGCHFLLAARPSLPLSQAAGTSNTSSSSRQQLPQTSRVTMGPGRHTILGLGGATGLPPVTPTTPGSHRRANLSTYGAARAHRRRQIRRKFEAMVSFLAGSGDLLPPPPESMLTQPPPPAQQAKAQSAAAAASLTGGAAFTHGGSGSVGRARAVNFAVADAAGPSTGSAVAGGRVRPKLSISLDGAGVSGGPEDVASASSGSSPKRGLSTASGGVTPASSSSKGCALPALSMGALHHGRGSSEGKMACGGDAATHACTAAAAGTAACGAGRVGSNPGVKSNKARHSSSAGAGAAATATAVACHGSTAGHAHGRAVTSSNGSGHAATVSNISSSGNALRLRQQVWREVQVMRTGLGDTTDSVPGTGVCAPWAASKQHAVEAGPRWGSWGTHRHGSASCWALSSTPPRPGSPDSTGVLLLSPAHSRPTSPATLLTRAAAGGGVVGAAASSLPGSSSTAAHMQGSTCSGTSSMFKWGSGFSLLSLTGAAGPGAAAAGNLRQALAVEGDHAGHAVCRHDARDATRTEKAVCFLTPRTQAAEAQALVQAYKPSSGPAAVQRPRGLQLLSSSTGSSYACSSTGTAGWSGDGAAVPQQHLDEQQQQWLVQCACKALGSAAAAQAYADALPEGQQLVNFTASGLLQLPSLHSLTQLEALSASFNKLTVLTGLLPANADAVDAAATAAAVSAAAAVTSDTPHRRETASAASSRPGTRGRTATPLTAAAAAAMTVSRCATVCQVKQQQQQQQHDAVVNFPRPGSAHSTDFFLSPQAVYDNTYQQYLTQLQQLTVSTAVCSLPASLLQLQLSHNQLAALPCELPAALPALTQLDVSHNRLQELPPTLGAMSGLKALFLQDNQLQQLPGCISLMQSLHTLHADHNLLSQLPAALCQLGSLSSLHLQHNQLQQLAEAFKQLTGLTSLGLGSNKLQQLPQGLIDKLHCLRHLDLSDNGLSDVELELAAVAAPISKQIDGSSRPASPAATRCAGNANCAAGLDGSCSRVSAGTGAIMLPSLLALDVSCNRLQQLPTWLPPSLVWLSAAHNSISQLSAAFCSQSASLQGLDMQGNLLSELPDELRLASKLQLLGLSRNPGLHPDLIEEGSGLSWAYKWLADKKQAAASAALRKLAEQSRR